MRTKKHIWNSTLATYPSAVALFATATKRFREQANATSMFSLPETVMRLVNYICNQRSRHYDISCVLEPSWCPPAIVLKEHLPLETHSLNHKRNCWREAIPNQRIGATSKMALQSSLFKCSDTSCWIQDEYLRKDATACKRMRGRKIKINIMQTQVSPGRQIARCNAFLYLLLA